MYASPVDSAIGIQPATRFHCSDERECSQIDLINTSSPVTHGQGKCSALLTREGFFDFLVLKTQCDVPQSISVVCQHNVRSNHVFSNNMSDIKLSLLDGFHSIQIFSSCDPGWFMVDGMCINFYHCPDCLDNSQAQEQCSMYGGQLAYHVLNNVSISTPGNKLDKNTGLSLFWNMFYNVEDVIRSTGNIFSTGSVYFPLQEYKKYFAVNGSALCVALHSSSECREGDVVLSVGYHTFVVEPYLYISSYDLENDNFLWSVIYQPIFEIAEYIYAHMSLCEKSVANASLLLTNCSEFYTSCHEGTCIHDSLVCDGYQHCPHGEDEADCQHICSDHSHNCMSHCHHRDLCVCSLEYFQCLSGGCVPLQKLCDQTVHCIDASDEPPTCVYLRPEQLAHHSLSLNINNYINTLIQQNMITQHRCLQSSNNRSLSHMQNVEYKMHSKQQACSPSSLSPNIKFVCGIFEVSKMASQHYFSLDHLCVYDHACDDNYTYHCFNGFHLLKCEHMYCVGRFKCPSSYCISLDHICNKVCDCHNCEDESICSKLLCPGMVLIEQIGSGRRCSMNVAAVKYSMNLRQVIHREGINITDDFPVLIYLDNAVNLRHFIFTPEVVVYCEILYSNLSITDLNVFHRMVSLRRLFLPHNGIQKVNDSMFVFMSQLIVLDISHNLIRYIPNRVLCSLHNLQYISLRHNLIAELPARIFINNPDVQVLLLDSNKLTPQSAIVDTPFSSLYRLSSDIPRFCCAFKTVKFCSPPFPFFVSCSDLITSKALIVLGWLIGLSTSILNLFCLSLLMYKLCSPLTQTKVVILYSINLSFAEFVTSLCLLSYSAINVAYHDVFGITADLWRHSLKCLSLESLFSVSSRTCLAFAVCLSVHFAIHIPSVIPKKSSKKATVFQIIFIWLIITSISIAVQVLEHIHNTDPLNYFCFPFTTSFPSDTLILSLQSLLLILDFILIIVTIVSYVYLLVFTIRRSQNKTLQCVDKRKERLQKLAARLTVLILSTVLTWIPVVCVQILVLAKITILPDIYFWCILVSFPINLIIDPILLIRNTLA